jgi:hypothetical protein
MMGSTPPLEMSSSMVPAVAPRPLLVGTFGDLVSRCPLLAQSAGLFGLRPVFRRPMLTMSSSLLSYESSLLTVLTPAPPPPPFGGCVRPLVVKVEGVTPLCLASSCEGSPP